MGSNHANSQIPCSVSSARQYSVHDVPFRMRLVPTSSLISGDNGDPSPIDTGLWIGETQVTYELWYMVCQWALGRSYRFGLPGMEGSGQIGELHLGKAPTAARKQPVTMVRWIDCTLWCNALSEFLGCDPLYTSNGMPLKDSMSRQFSVDSVQKTAVGFRLPLSDEWVYAARYIDGSRWTPKDYASGAGAPSDDHEATNSVAWYDANSGDTTHNVGEKRANALGLYDMSGNVGEWCSDWQPGRNSSERIIRGGDYFSASTLLEVGRSISLRGDLASRYVGFRIAMQGSYEFQG